MHWNTHDPICQRTRKTNALAALARLFGTSGRNSRANTRTNLLGECHRTHAKQQSKMYLPNCRQWLDL